MSKRNGFTLIELMIVVGIISIICAIAIPNLLRSQIQANESATIQDLRAIAGAQISFNTTHLRFGSLAELTEITAGPPYLDSGWTEGRVKNGYIFTVPTVTTGSFECFAAPETVGVSGNRYFRVDASGVIRFSNSGAPSNTDTPV